MSRFSRAPFLLTVFIAFAAVGCSSGSHQPQVAALPASAGPSSAAQTSTASDGTGGTSASAGASASSRPRERLDETPAQIDALYAPWNQCLAAHGAKAHTAQAGPAARAACVNLQPLPPWQYDPANPNALGFVQRVVACLHQHGVQYAQVQNSPGDDRIAIALGGPQNDQTSISRGLQLIPVCNEQVLHADAGSTSS
jgi:hypothetical protein